MRNIEEFKFAKGLVISRNYNLWHHVVDLSHICPRLDLHKVYKLLRKVNDGVVAVILDTNRESDDAGAVEILKKNKVAILYCDPQSIKERIFTSNNMYSNEFIPVC